MRRFPKSIRETWGEMIEGYLRNREQLKLALMLVDCRIPPTESDRTMKEWLDHHGIPNAVRSDEEPTRFHEMN